MHFPRGLSRPFGVVLWQLCFFENALPAQSVNRTSPTVVYMYAYLPPLLKLFQMCPITLQKEPFRSQDTKVQGPPSPDALEESGGTDGDASRDGSARLPSAELEPSRHVVSAQMAELEDPGAQLKLRPMEGLALREAACRYGPSLVDQVAKHGKHRILIYQKSKVRVNTRAPNPRIT